LFLFFRWGRYLRRSSRFGWFTGDRKKIIPVSQTGCGRKTDGIQSVSSQRRVDSKFYIIIIIIFFWKLILITFQFLRGQHDYHFTVSGLNRLCAAVRVILRIFDLTTTSLLCRPTRGEVKNNNNLHSVDEKNVKPAFHEES